MVYKQGFWWADGVASLTSHCHCIVYDMCHVAGSDTRDGGMRKTDASEVTDHCSRWRKYNGTCPEITMMPAVLASDQYPHTHNHSAKVSNAALTPAALMSWSVMMSSKVELTSLNLLDPCTVQSTLKYCEVRKCRKSAARRWRPTTRDPKQLCI